MSIPILIPAFNPDENLIGVVEGLQKNGTTDIIVVDDGSNPDSKNILRRLSEYPGCHIYSHAVNLGKGRAIKSGLNYAVNKFPELKGVVTADADGQHLPGDIIRVRKELSANPDKLILGSRKFDCDIPFRSKLGNIITKKVFHLLTGIKISDTQTGLRGIPFAYIPECLRLDGEKYEYEINMLVSCSRNRISLKEIPIETVYLENNRSSHFNPVLDSIKIYFVLFRFLLSSLTTALIDFIVFIICTGLGLKVLPSIILSRLVAGNYNFIVNKKIVFRSDSGYASSFLKYWMLVILLGSISYFGISSLVNYLNFNVLLAKAIIESILFVVSFAVQRILVFNSSELTTEK